MVPKIRRYFDTLAAKKIMCAKKITIIDIIWSVDVRLSGNSANVNRCLVGCAD